jgi:hypothetical protein
LANETFIKGKRREYISNWWNPVNWLVLIFWDGLAGYGRKPGRTFGLSILIIFIGAYFFDPRFLEIKSIKKWKWFSDISLLNNERFINLLKEKNFYKYISLRFILSLDRFLPGVNLGLAKSWEPDNIEYKIWLYWHIHKILGWILIPIGLAAIYTQIK